MAVLFEILSRFVVEFLVLLAGRRLAGLVPPLHAFELGRRPRSDAGDLLLVGTLFAFLAAAQALAVGRVRDGACEWLLAASATVMALVSLVSLGLALRARLRC